jgi:adenosylcobinamide kinase/adenosylcobinamide-phosphate guanylyltransferase
VPAGRPVLVDCLTLWLSNHMLVEHDLDALSDELENVLSAPRGPWFVVSNEVGLGIVPDNPLGRRFRDAQGRLNQRVAAVATHVLFMVAGLPMQVK